MSIAIDNTTLPEPGIYKDVSFAQYLAWPCVNNSSLTRIARSLRYYKRAVPVEETPAMRLGTLTHAGKLEPSSVFKRYVVMPDFTVGIKNKDGELSANPRNTKEYKAKVAEFTIAHHEKQIVTTEEFEAMCEMATQLDRHPRVREWFSDDGETELSIVWDDPLTMLRCKARIDKLSKVAELLVDLKSTFDCLKFQHAIFDRRYHCQGAFYCDGWKALTGKEYGFGIAAVENREPYGVMAAPLSERTLELGRDEYQRCLLALKKAQVTNEWPDYESPKVWSPPAWADREESFELSFGGEVYSL